MHRPGVLALALLLVVLPTLAERCDMGCDLAPSALARAGAGAAACPLHRGTPARPEGEPLGRRHSCGHDHVTARVAEAGARVVLSCAFDILADTFAADKRASAPEARPISHQLSDSPPRRPADTSTVLRV